MFGSKYILVLTLAINMVDFPTTFGQWGEMTTTTTTKMPGWTTKPKCSKYCSGDQTTVCLDGEDVPKCYAQCKHRVCDIWFIVANYCYF
jgi:hypothetical protein